MGRRNRILTNDRFRRSTLFCDGQNKNGSSAIKIAERQ
ncbi:hypothetical protein STRDD13_00943 [Streptococcus sp. DD13]|nr:hypothetical protein STRDD13_00943 [Streptococcus sp. DD13]